MFHVVKKKPQKQQRKWQQQNQNIYHFAYSFLDHSISIE